MLSKPAYATFYYILPVILIMLVFESVYRLSELWMGIALRHRTFLVLWPFSFISLAAIYLTIDIFKIWSLVIIPLVEISTRVGVLLFLGRNIGIIEAVDPLRSGQMILSAGLLLLGSLVLKVVVGFESQGLQLLLATIVLIIFCGSLIIVSPIRPREAEVFLKMFPHSGTLVRRIIALAKR
jgi:hypothetical protein